MCFDVWFEPLTWRHDVGEGESGEKINKKKEKKNNPLQNVGVS